MTFLSSCPCEGVVNLPAITAGAVGKETAVSVQQE